MDTILGLLMVGTGPVPVYWFVSIMCWWAWMIFWFVSMWKDEPAAAILCSPFFAFIGAFGIMVLYVLLGTLLSLIFGFDVVEDWVDFTLFTISS